MDHLGRCTRRDYDFLAVTGQECPEKDGGDQGTDSLRCEENILDCTISIDGTGDWEVDGASTPKDARDRLPLHLRPDGTWEDYGSTADPEYHAKAVSEALLLQQERWSD